MDAPFVAEGFSFQFAGDLVEACIFDNNEKCVPQSHLRPVDIIAEFPDEYLFIELKKFRGGGIQFKCPVWSDEVVSICPLNTDETKRAKTSVKRLANDLREKYYQTFINWYAQGKLNKKVRYICMTDGLGLGEIVRLQSTMESQMPIGEKLQGVFVHPILAGLAVVDSKLWNQNELLLRYGSCSTI